PLVPAERGGERTGLRRGRGITNARGAGAMLEALPAADARGMGSAAAARQGDAEHRQVGGLRPVTSFGERCHGRPHLTPKPRFWRCDRPRSEISRPVDLGMRWMCRVIVIFRSDSVFTDPGRNV